MYTATRSASPSAVCTGGRPRRAGVVTGFSVVGLRLLMEADAAGAEVGIGSVVLSVTGALDGAGSSAGGLGI